MPTYEFVALDANGREVSGEVDADSQADALSLIKEKNMFPTSISKAGAKPRAKKRKAATSTSSGSNGLQTEIKLPAFLTRVKTKELMVFTRQLATLINAGLPLLRSLRVLHRQERNSKLKSITTDMAEAIESGSTFAEALAQHPSVFNKLFVNMVKAGELGGVLDVVLVRLAEFMEKAQKIKGKIISAMIYPVVVLVMAVAILTFLMIVIIPKFEQIFSDLLGDKGLPALTEFVLSVSRGMANHILYVAGGVVLLVVIVKLIGMSGGGRYALDVIKIHMPVFGNLTRKTAISRFSRTLGTLMNSGVPVLQALTIVRETIGNAVVSKAIGMLHDSVKEGESMAPTLESAGVFPPMVVSMVEVGEETGALPAMLMKIADAYDDEVDNAVAGMTSVIEPILIILLALVVGTIVIALFLPLLSIIGELGNQ